jgi:hypothetical protein
VNNSLANELLFLISPPSAAALKRTNSDEALKGSALPGQVVGEDVGMKDAHVGMSCKPPPPRFLNWMGFMCATPHCKLIFGIKFELDGVQVGSPERSRGRRRVRSWCAEIYSG